MPPPEPLPPIAPTPPPGAGDPQAPPGHNPYQSHIARPKDVPLQTVPEQPANPVVVAPVAPSQAPPAEHDYSFILNHAEAARPPVKLPSSNSLLARVVVVAGGLLVLLIIFAVVKGLVTHQPNLTSVISVAQDQQAILHLVSGASQEQTLSGTNQNFVATAGLSLNSAQTQLLSYLSANNLKVGPKTLNLKVKTALDTQLATASAAGTYNSTFQEIMQAELTTYANDLKQAYAQDKGHRGRSLLQSNFQQAQLLLTQLTPPAS